VSQGTLLRENVVGRRSYFNFNPAIQSLQNRQKKKQEEEQSERREKANTVTDEEMAERYNTMNNFYARKKQRRN
jgi:hypothetical protein